MIKNRRVVRLNDDSYNALLKIKESYKKEIGIEPQISQVLEKAIADLYKLKCIKSAKLGRSE